MTKPVLNSELVDTFWDLAQGGDEKRISAAKRLINVIRRFQIKVRYWFLNGKSER